MRGCSMYRFFDAQDRLLYVGITSVGPSRWSDHEAHKAWWVLVVRTTVEHFDDRALAAAAERTAILTEQPLHNVVHMKPPRPRATSTKRRHGTGGITRKSDGRWAVNAYIDGVRRQWSIRDEAAARLLLAAIEGRSLPRADRERAMDLLDELP